MKSLLALHAPPLGRLHILQLTWRNADEYRWLLPVLFAPLPGPDDRYGLQSSPCPPVHSAQDDHPPATRSSRHSRCTPESKRWLSEPATHAPAQSHRCSYRDIHRQRSVPAACAGQLPASPHVAYRVLQVPLLDEEYGNDDAGRASDDASFRQLHDDN